MRNAANEQGMRQSRAFKGEKPLQTAFICICTHSPPKQINADVRGRRRVGSPNTPLKLLISKNERTKGYICVGWITVSLDMNRDMPESSPDFEIIPISAAIISTIPHIIVILSAAERAAPVMSSAESLGHTLSLQRSGMGRKGAVIRAYSRFVPVTASITDIHAPLQSGAAMEDIAII